MTPRQCFWQLSHNLPSKYVSILWNWNWKRVTFFTVEYQSMRERECVHVYNKTVRDMVKLMWPSEILRTLQVFPSIFKVPKPCTHPVIQNLCHCHVSDVEAVWLLAAILGSIRWSPQPRRLCRGAAPWPRQSGRLVRHILLPFRSHDSRQLGPPWWSPWWKTWAVSQRLEVVVFSLHVDWYCQSCREKMKHFVHFTVSLKSYIYI